VLVEDALLAERLEVELQALGLDGAAARPVPDHDLRPVGLAGDRAAAGELAAAQRDLLGRVVDLERLELPLGHGLRIAQLGEAGCHGGSVPVHAWELPPTGDVGRRSGAEF
jgi:hypothetical protein